MVLTENRRIKIIPFWVGRFDQIDLVSARPFLDPLFPMDCIHCRGKDLEINQSLYAVLLCETVDERFAMFMNSAGDIVRHADIDRTVWLAGENIDEKLPLRPHLSMIWGT